MDIRYTEDLAEVRKALKYAETNGLFLDLETTGLNPRTDSIVHIVIASGPNAAIVFPPQSLLLSELAGARPLLFCAHNMKFDLAFLYCVGVDLRLSCAVFRDTMLLQHLLNEEGPFGLDDIIQSRWQDPYKQIFWSKHDSYTDAPLNEQAAYAGRDTIYLQKLYHTLVKEYNDDLMPPELIEHAHRLAMALYDTEVTGIKVDLAYLTDLGCTLTVQSDKLFTELNAEAGANREAVELDMYVEELDKRKTPKGKAGVERPAFNWDSNKQLMALFYDKMELPVQKHKRKPTVNSEALEALAEINPIANLLSRYRKLRKTYTSFVEGTLKHAHEGRVYPKFKIHGTVTGRISSADPNFQQVPRDGGVRGIYVPDEGNILFSADMAQLEVVIAAHYSQDKALLSIIFDGASKHDITANALKISRNTAKTINFAAQYGATSRKFQQILGCSLNDAEDVFRIYWETYSGEKAVVDQCRLDVDDGMPIVNIMGRRRRFPDQFEAQWRREEAYRAAYSALIQGSGADLVHEACYMVAEKLKKLARGRLIAEIHDELVVECKPEDYEFVANIVKTEMEAPGVKWGLTVPLKAEVGKPKERWGK